jgi:hypothetical protein
MPSSDHAGFLEAEVTLLAVHGLADDHMVQQLDLKNPGAFSDPASKSEIGFGWACIPAGMVVYENETMGCVGDYRGKNFPWMSRSFVNRAFGNINQRDQALLRIQEQDSKHFLFEKLHIGARAINRVWMIKHIRTSMLTLCDQRHGESNHHRLGFRSREELAELLKGSPRQRLHRTKVTDQSRSDLFLADKQREMLQAGQRGRTVEREFLRDRRREAPRRRSSLLGTILKFAFELKNMLRHIFRPKAKQSKAPHGKRQQVQEPRACRDGSRI